MPTVALLSLIVALLPQAPAAPSAPQDPFAALAELAPQPATPRGVPVVVRDAEGRPLAGAKVVFASSDLTQPRRMDMHRMFPGDEPVQIAWMVGAGTAFALDERGTTRVPPKYGTVFAWLDDAMAFEQLVLQNERPPARLELVLRTPRRVAVRTLDAAGAPLAAVPVGVFAAGANAAYVQHVSGADGAGTLRLFDRPSAQLLLRAMIASPTTITAPIVADAPTELRLPPCGSVRAKFTGDLLPGATVSWSIRCDGQSMQAEAIDATTGLFRHVAVGVTGSAQATLTGLSITTELPAIEAGRTHDVAADRPAGRRRIVLRALDAVGQPLRNRVVRTGVRSGNSTHGSSLRTTSDGWLEIQAPGGTNDLKISLSCQGPVDGDGQLSAAEFEVPGDRAATATGRIDWGEVRFAAAPIVLAGRVVDTKGNPVTGVRLTMARGARSSVISGADGTFRLAAAGTPDPVVTLELRDHTWYFAEADGSGIRREASVSGLDVRLVVVPAGRMRIGGKPVPEGCHHDFSARLEGANGERIDVMFPVGARELLLPPGTWDYVVHENGTELHRIETVRVDPGIEVHDARFMDFDWSKFAVFVTLRVEDKDGKPLDDCTVWHEMGNTSSGFSPSKGVANLLLPKDGGRIRIEPEDKAFAAIPLGVVTQDQHVRLGQGPRLTVSLSRVPELPAGVELLALVGESHDGKVFDATGTAGLWLSGPGDCTVTLGVRRGNSTHVVSSTQKTVDVPAGGATLKFDLDAATTAAIAAAAAGR